MNEVEHLEQVVLFGRYSVKGHKAVFDMPAIPVRKEGV